MIATLQFNDLSQSSFAYASKLPFFQANSSVTFKPGLNVLFAPNGSGKSTLLNMLSLATACQQGGVSTVTQSWLTDVEQRGHLKGVDVAHDGQAVMYANPRNAVGLVGGMAGFDDDFFEEGVRNATSKSSTGYTTMERLGKALNALTNPSDFPNSIPNKVPNKSLPETLIARFPEGPRTFLLDEPESGLGIPAQSNLFNLLAKYAPQHQVIVATHSPFALTLDAHFIELTPGYVQSSRDSLRLMSTVLSIQSKVEQAKARRAP